MKSVARIVGLVLGLTGVTAFASSAIADELPQQVNTRGLPKLGDKWIDQNPFPPGSPNNKLAIEVGGDAFAQNCARCHGLEMISGGIAPDLRHVPLGQEGDELFSERMQHGAKRNDVTMMPVFFGLLPQEALWSIRAYMISKHIDD